MPPITLLSSVHLRKIGIGSLVFLISGVGSVFAAAPTSDQGLFAKYFQNIANTNCLSDQIFRNFTSTTGSPDYLKGNCVSIGPIIGSWFAGKNVPTGNAIIGFDANGNPISGRVASQWSGDIGQNIYYNYPNANVGIGTASPDVKLTVAGPIRAADLNYPSGTPNVFIGDDSYLTDLDIANTVGLWGVQDNTKMGLQLGKNGGWIYGNNGNIGIGPTSTNPKEKLDISGGLARNLSDGSGKPALFIAGSGWKGRESSFVSIGIVHGNGANGLSWQTPGIWGGNVGFAIGRFNSTATYDDPCCDKASVDGKVDGNGNLIWNNKIGIGTSNPTSKLEVAGQVKITGGSPALNKILTSDATGLASWKTFLETDPKVGANTLNYLPKWNGTSLSTSSIIDKSGYIGIGTSNPRRSLDVAGEIVATNRITLAQNTNTTSPTWHMDNNTDQFRIFRQPNINAGGNSFFEIKNNGNVGIGTASPSTKLQVAGEVTSTSANAFRMVAGNYGAFWRNDGGNVWLLSTNAGDQYGGWSAFRPFQYNLTSGNVTLANNALTALINGNVGIGNTNPTEKLTVNGNTIVSGNVGIGTTTPDHKLTVASKSDAVAHFMSDGGNAYLRLSIYNDITRRIELANRDGRTALWNPQSGDVFNILHSNGNVGIGTTSPSSKLDVRGEVTSRYLNDAAGIYSQFRALWGNYGFMIRNDGSNTYFLLTNSGDQQGKWNDLRPLTINNTSGDVTINTKLRVNNDVYANNYYYTSDKRLKKDIAPIISPLEKIKALSGYTFAWKDTGIKSVGLIAQEVEKIFPELVGETQTASGMTIKTVQYGNLVAPLIESVKELSRLHDEDTKKISDLEEQIQAMHADIEKLRIQIQK